MLKNYYKAYKYNHAGHTTQWPAFFVRMKTLYLNRIRFFFFIHIFSLLITGVVSTVLASQKYVYGKQRNDFISKYKKFENNSRLLRTYFRYTGTETGFGFFAPDVKSHGAMFFESCGTLMDLPFETNEGNIRGNCLITNATDYIKEELEYQDAKPTIKHSFSDLLIQNLVAKVRQVNKLEKECKTVKVEYKLVEFPPLQSTSNTKSPILFDIKTWIYETKN